MFFFLKKALPLQRFGSKIDKALSPRKSKSSRFQAIKVDPKESLKQALAMKNNAVMSLCLQLILFLYHSLEEAVRSLAPG